MQSYKFIMKKLLILSLIIIAAFGDVAKSGYFAFKWKSSSLFPNCTVVEACVGDNVTFPWVFDMTSTKQVVIEWSKTSENKPDQEKHLALAKYSRDQFYGLSPERDVEFLSNAGIKLSNVTLADKGVYTVEIISFGHPESYKQIAFLQVYDAPVIASDELHAFILPDIVYNSRTGIWHVQLGCRPPVIRGQSVLPVIWTTPSNQTAFSTSYKNNTFILELPCPMEEGDYSCSLNSSVPAVKCISTHLNTSRAATVNVKGVNTRLSYLEGSVESLSMVQSKFDDITAMVQRNNDSITAMVQSKFDNFAGIVQSKFDNITAMVQSKIDGITSMVQSKFDNITAMVQSKIAIVLQEQSGVNQIFMDSVRRPASCVDVQKYDKVSGVHTLLVNDITVKVYCDQSTDNGGWTVFQRRQDGSVDFYRNWEQYEKAFGDVNGEFWIGLTNLHLLTKSKTVKLRVDLTDFDGSTAYAFYNTFSISGADDNYRLNVGGYSGTAGDSLKGHNKMQFSTFDRDHDIWSYGNCAERRESAWWYSVCDYSNLNGRYKSDGASGADGILWHHWKSLRSLKRVEMKIKE